MPILRDIPISLSAEEILASGGKRRFQPGLLRDAEEAIALGQTLWQPMAYYDWFEVRGVEGEHVSVILPNGASKEAVLQVGPKADLMAAAQRLVVAVGTLGPALERKVYELQQGGEALAAYLLDSAGVVALGAVGEAVRSVAEGTARELGWGVGPAISPGSLVGWPLQGQRQLCALLSLESIGVRLNEYFVLEPHKSFSAAIGIGPGYESKHVGSICKFCALQDTCWRRREDPS
ncbi:MAG: hypothetical protein ACP5JJ_19475 [Anaerolineae bacterium]